MVPRGPPMLHDGLQGGLRWPGALLGPSPTRQGSFDGPLGSPGDSLWPSWGSLVLLEAVFRPSWGLLGGLLGRLWGPFWEPLGPSRPLSGPESEYPGRYVGNICAFQ
eukprot:3584567-Pyramimonas_sp.AAC.1